MTWFHLLLWLLVVICAAVTLFYFTESIRDRERRYAKSALGAIQGSYTGGGRSESELAQGGKDAQLFIDDEVKLVVDGHNLIHDLTRGKRLTTAEFTHTLGRVTLLLRTAVPNYDLHIVTKNPPARVQSKAAFVKAVSSISREHPNVTYHLAYSEPVTCSPSTLRTRKQASDRRKSNAARTPTGSKRKTTQSKKSIRKKRWNAGRARSRSPAGKSRSRKSKSRGRRGSGGPGRVSRGKSRSRGGRRRYVRNNKYKRGGASSPDCCVYGEAEARLADLPAGLAVDPYASLSLDLPGREVELENVSGGRRTEPHYMKGRDDYLVIYLAADAYIVSKDRFRDFRDFRKIPSFTHITLREGNVLEEELLEPQHDFGSLRPPGLGNHFIYTIMPEHELHKMGVSNGAIYLDKDSVFPRIYLATQ